jgi:hypothetical protein
VSAVATITGTAVMPGVSRNKRFYTPAAIGKAVARAQARIEAGGMPLTMRVSHPTDEPRATVTEIVGRITKVWQETDGRARFTADIARTPEGQTVATLIDTRKGDGPYLTGVSIRGNWVGDARTVQTADGLAETADDLEIDGLDFTHKPGVIGARVEQVHEPAQSAYESSASGRWTILESVQEALVTAIDEADAPAQATTPVREADAAPAAANKEPYGNVTYADPGYQSDRVKRYPLDTKKKAKAAWGYINQPDNAKLYTANQLKRVRQRIIKALKSFGVDVDVKEGWTIERSQTVAEAAPAGEVTEGYYGMDRANFSVCLDNGMVCITVSSYCIDPADLDIVARQGMAGACAALALIDPDDDGDIDIPGQESNEPVSAPPTQVATITVVKAPAEADATPAVAAVAEGDASSVDGLAASQPVATPAPNPAAEPITETEEAAVSEPTTTPAAGGDLSDAAIDKIAGKVGESVGAALQAVFARFVPQTPAPAAEAAPAAAAIVAEAAPAPAAVTETEDQRIQRLVDARLTAALQAHVAQNGAPARRGIVGRVTESGTVQGLGGGEGEVNEYGMPAHWPNKPLDKFTAEEREKYMAPALAQHVIGHRL